MTMTEVGRLVRATCSCGVQAETILPEPALGPRQKYLAWRTARALGHEWATMMDADSIPSTTWEILLATLMAYEGLRHEPWMHGILRPVLGQHGQHDPYSVVRYEIPSHLMRYWISEDWIPLIREGVQYRTYARAVFPREKRDILLTDSGLISFREVEGEFGREYVLLDAGEPMAHRAEEGLRALIVGAWDVEEGE